MMNNKEHLTLKGLEKIVYLRYKFLMENSISFLGCGRIQEVRRLA